MLKKGAGGFFYSTPYISGEIMSAFLPAKNIRTSQQGFTLVEMSIVLVIIGLIVGGVLLGQDLIRQGEITSLTTQVDQYQTAVNTFQVKYNAFPGDLASANTIITGAVDSKGNNDGVLDSGSLPTSYPTTIGSDASNEFLGFWNQLGAAGMIEGAFSASTASLILPNNSTGTQPNAPGLKTGRGGFFAYGMPDRKNYMQLGVMAAASTTITTANNLRPDEAFGIDKKIDDGNPNSGNILARGAGAAATGSLEQPALVTTAATPASGNTPAQPAVAGCVTSNAATGVYSTANTAYLCQLRVKLN